MKNSRLFEIIYLLLEHQELTAGWLAEKLEVSKRTIYRDIDALSASGIPIYCQKGSGGGIRLMKQFQLDRSLLDEKEQEDLLMALQSLRALGTFDGSSLLSRLSVLFQKKPGDWLEVDFGSWGKNLREQQYFELCKETIFSHRLLQFTYYNSVGEESRRTVEPLCLYYKGSAWYLKAYCREKKDYRMFRLNRIVDLQALDETFPVRDTLYQKSASPSISPSGIPDKASDSLKESPASAPPHIPDVHLTLLFSHEAAYRVMDAFLLEEIQCQDDGSFLVRTSYPPGSWIVTFLLSFGKEVRVLEPEWVRQELAKEAAEILKNNSQP